MRKIKYILGIALCFILVIAFYAQPLAIYFAKQRLKNIFPESAVSIGACIIKPLSLIAFLNIEISKPPAFVMKLKQAEVHYQPISLLKGNASFSFTGLDCDFGKLRFRDCNGRAVIRGKRADLELSSSNIFGGRIQGNARLEANERLEYSAEFNLTGIKIDEFIEDFEFGEKFKMSGKFSGTARIEGNGDSLEMLSGSLSAEHPGGTLVITDSRFLESVARASGQSFEMLVESFKNYRYNTGILKLSLDKGDLIFDIALDGEAGRRKLGIVAHDFELRNLIPQGKRNQRKFGLKERS